MNTLEMGPFSETPCRSSTSRCAVVITSVLCTLTVSLDSLAEQPKVTITGGADVSGHNYEWTVRNGHTSPIVYIEFPHYHADMFFAPEGWTGTSPYKVNVGVSGKPGVCTAKANSPASAIAPGRSAVFRMRIAASGAKRRLGKVLVRFADGTEDVVADVELPHQKYSRIDKIVNVGGFFLIGLGAMVVIAIRNRRAAAGEASTGSVPSDDA